MSLLPRTTLHSDSEQLESGRVRPGKKVRSPYRAGLEVIELMAFFMMMIKIVKIYRKF